MKIFGRGGDGLVLYRVWQEASCNNWKIAQNIPLETTDRTWVLNAPILKAPQDLKCGITVASTNTGTINFWLSWIILNALLGKVGQLFSFRYYDNMEIPYTFWGKFTFLELNMPLEFLLDIFHGLCITVFRTTDAVKQKNAFSCRTSFFPCTFYSLILLSHSATSKTFSFVCPGMLSSS